ncbi:MAG: Txe/YoeB family addiction module toxin [Sphingomonas bacterium]|nr:Txe/YoeB family addiction module toxin [Sphingomonas bacterium]
MKISFRLRAWEEYRFWQANDAKMLARVDALIADTMRSPFKGIGKPEPLRENLSGWWSRRIDGEHRLAYPLARIIDDQMFEILQCRYHY